MVRGSEGRAGDVASVRHTVNGEWGMGNVCAGEGTANSIDDRHCLYPGVAASASLKVYVTGNTISGEIYVVGSDYAGELYANNAVAWDMDSKQSGIRLYSSLPKHVQVLCLLPHTFDAAACHLPHAQEC